MKRIPLFFFAIILFILFVFTSSSKQGVSKTHDGNAKNISPNIIFLIADDLGWDAFGAYPEANGKKANTPTLDSLAHSGITFLNFWVNPVCAPTRASLLTGKYSFRTGVGGVQQPQTATLKDNEIIIQKFIDNKTRGKYATAIIGKWHISADKDIKAPENFGVQYYSGIFKGAVDDYYNWTQTSDGNEQTINTYTTTHFVNQSIEWIKRQDKPFFLWLAFNAPHIPFHRPPLNLITNKSLSDSPDSIKSNPLPYFLAAIEAMDKEISRLISSLSAPQRENTVIIFIGDNGTSRNIIQKPYLNRQGKNSLFQGGINTPLIVSGKNITRKNVVETSLVQAQDIFSTFADLAGTGIKNYQDGISIKPLFKNANAPKRTFAYSEKFGGNQPTDDGYTIRNSKYKLIHLTNETELFFNLIKDPFETNNLLLNTLPSEAQQNLDQLRKIKTGL